MALLDRGKAETRRRLLLSRQRSWRVIALRLIEASGLFDVTEVRRYVWQTSYSADEYIALLNTFSGHIAMESAKREHLYREIRERIGSRPDARVRRHWYAILHVARRANPRGP